MATGEVSFIHLSVALDDHSIDRANFVWKYDERVPERYGLELTSDRSFPHFRWATCGTRLASASRPRRLGGWRIVSRAVPPESIRITIAATRFSPRITEVMIEIPAR